MSYLNPTNEEKIRILRNVRDDIILADRWAQEDWADTPTDTLTEDEGFVDHHVLTCNTKFCFGGGILFYALAPLNRVQEFRRAWKTDSFTTVIEETPPARAVFEDVAKVLDPDLDDRMAPDCIDTVINYNDNLDTKASDIVNVINSTIERLSA